jgi:hypothetical protein
VSVNVAVVAICHVGHLEELNGFLSTCHAVELTLKVPRNHRAHIDVHHLILPDGGSGENTSGEVPITLKDVEYPIFSLEIIKRYVPP